MSCRRFVPQSCKHHIYNHFRILHVPIGAIEPMKRKFNTMETLIDTNIKLNDAENKLRKLLVDAAEHISNKHSDIPQLELRWSGGWVRDKLLGLESNDIDTAINSMTGEQFADGLKEFCKDTEILQKYGLKSADLGHLATIKKNPEKSKNLETVTTKLLGIECDFVNLRKETYVEDSRNPVVEFGTPQEDAERRDATINALFYNIHTNKVEDLVGGIPDLKKKYIRTPLDPLVTFTDDPLRILRLVRFASRFRFDIAPEAEAVMADKKVLHALKVKISRERVGVELEKMLKGNNPLLSLELIDRLKLYHAIFTDPTTNDIEQPDITHWSQVYKTVDDLFQKHTTLWKCLVRCREDEYFAWLLAAIVPWEFVKDPNPPKRKSSLGQCGRVAREGFKATNKFTKVLEGATNDRSEIIKLKEEVRLKKDTLSQREHFGMPIRRWDGHNHSWRLSVLAAMLYEVLNAASSQPPKLCKSGISLCSTSIHPRFFTETYPTITGLASIVVEEWQQFLDHIQKLDLLEVSSLKPLVSGSELAAALNRPPGPWMSKALDECMAWQLRNPDCTSTKEAIEEVKQLASKLEVS